MPSLLSEGHQSNSFHLGRIFATEPKKERYVYYHCTKSKGPCDEMYYREEDLAPQFDAIVKGITIDPNIRDWLVQALK